MAIRMVTFVMVAVVFVGYLCGFFMPTKTSHAITSLFAAVAMGG